MNPPTANNILFLYNKVNSLLSPWHTHQSHCIIVSSFQAKTLAAISSIYMLPTLLVQTPRASLSRVTSTWEGCFCSLSNKTTRAFPFSFHHNRLLPLLPAPSLLPPCVLVESLPHLSLPLLQWLCYTDFLLGW